MATTSDVIIGLAAQQIQDVSGVRWGLQDVMLGYFNLGMAEIVNLKPEAYPVKTTIALIAGPTQSLGNNAVALIDAVANMGTDGNNQGNAITAIDKTKMDDLLPDWMTHTANATVAMAITDSRTPKIFYVYPPQPSGANNQQVISVIQSEVPAPVGYGNDFPLDDSYVPAMVDYLIHRALGEETTVEGAQQKSANYLNKFHSDLGLKTNVENQNLQKGQ